MTSFEPRQEQLASHLGSGGGSSTQANVRIGPDAECQEGLRQKLSNLKASIPSLPSLRPTSHHAQIEDPQPSQQGGSDSGIGIATTPSKCTQHEPPGKPLEGTKLRWFDLPVPDKLKGKFFDIKNLYTRDLLDYISVRKRDPGDLSMKLRYLGVSSQHIQLHIVIQCEKKVARKVGKFFAKKHVEQNLSPDFRVLVLEKTLLRLGNDGLIQVLADSTPDKTWCGTPIKFNRRGMSAMATFGGVIMVETSCQHLYGLTAAHSLKGLQADLHKYQEVPGRDETESLSSTETSVGDSDFAFASATTTESSLQHLDNPSIEEWDSNATLGSVFCDTLSSPMAENYDWAIVDLIRPEVLPNALFKNQQSDVSDSEEEAPHEATIHLESTSSPNSISRPVLVLKQGTPQKGELLFDASCIMISPGSTFVEVHDLHTDPNSPLSPGDSGSWVVDSKTLELYGHIVSVDAFDEAQVMPIHPTLESIKLRLSASRVFLPTAFEIEYTNVCQQASLLTGLEERRAPSKIHEELENMLKHEVMLRHRIKSTTSLPSFDDDQLSGYALGPTRNIDPIRDISTSWEELDILLHIELVYKLISYTLHRTETITDFRGVANKLLHLSWVLWRLRGEATDQQSILHTKSLHAHNLRSTIELCIFRLSQVVLQLDNYPHGSATSEFEMAKTLGLLKYTEISIAGDVRRISSLLQTVQLEKQAIENEDMERKRKQAIDDQDLEKGKKQTYSETKMGRRRKRTRPEVIFPWPKLLIVIFRSPKLLIVRHKNPWALMKESASSRYRVFQDDDGGRKHSHHFVQPHLYSRDSHQPEEEQFEWVDVDSLEGKSTVGSPGPGSNRSDFPTDRSYDLKGSPIDSKTSCKSWTLKKHSKSLRLKSRICKSPELSDRSNT
ncbi:hypothetical protein FMUND_17 [Fusarium mundagurra]|uniref:Uncharacterized protein n=1 Tax=Fusarium mundagurra TaxID=1567541 RepID=A0A8H5Z5K2_9HYPO|nr:hypothetical protein FMUND_17 [Fusarium mundagurra]